MPRGAPIDCIPSNHAAGLPKSSSSQRLSMLVRVPKYRLPLSTSPHTCFVFLSGRSRKGTRRNVNSRDVLDRSMAVCSAVEAKYPWGHWVSTYTRYRFSTPHMI